MGEHRVLWPIGLLVLATVLIPTICVLWFMNAAVQNERWAVQEKLRDVYKAEMAEAALELETYWADHFRWANGISDTENPASLFFRIIEAEISDSVIVCDTSGNVLYPDEVSMPSSDAITTDEWLTAEQLEFVSGDFQAAADAYNRIWNSATPEAEKKAMIAQARCLEKLGDRAAALNLLLPLSKINATDNTSRRVALNAHLRSLQLVPQEHWNKHQLSGNAFVDSMNSYSDGVIPSSQRRFLMSEFMKLTPEKKPFKTFDAEILAENYLNDVNLGVANSHFAEASLPGYVHVMVPGKRYNVVYISNHARFVAKIKHQLNAGLFSETFFELKKAGQEADPNALATLVLDDGLLAGWKFSTLSHGSDPFEKASRRQITVYVWAGILAVLAIGILSFLTIRYVAGQMKVARMKNEFLSTVSHELKTPVASTRVLLDTLLEGRSDSPEQEREYLELIAKQNLRLSGLIDNFLTFSRMDEKRHTFEFNEVEVKDVAIETLEAADQRFEDSTCKVSVEIDENLPHVVADHDALTTVVLNLLDNAYKYSNGERKIGIHAYRSDNSVCIAVRDNGIGISARDKKKIMKRFYQVDQSLSRSTEGCGLGLSIVDFIVSAHGGTVEVESEPGVGSTFTIKLPAAEEQN
jgi:signal transduction histidine kinase